MATTPAPKTKQTTILNVDLGKGLGDERVLGHDISYREAPPWRYGSLPHVRQTRTVIRMGENNQTIRGTFSGKLAKADVKRFMAWLAANTVWHSTEFSEGRVPRKTVRGTIFEVPTWDPTDVRVYSVFMRKMTKEQIADLATVEKNKVARIEKEKLQRKEHQAKERKARAEAKKRQAELEKRAESKRQEVEFTDLAQALKVLSKHGLKIVTVDEDGKTVKGYK